MEVKPEDPQKHSDYLLLIQARLYGWSGSTADKEERLRLSTKTTSGLMLGRIDGFSLSQLIAIARKAGVVVKDLYPVQQFST